MSAKRTTKSGNTGKGAGTSSQSNSKRRNSSRSSDQNTSKVRGSYSDEDYSRGASSKGGTTRSDDYDRNNSSKGGGSYSNDDHSRSSSKDNDRYSNDSNSSSKGGGYSEDDYSRSTSKDNDRYSNDSNSSSKGGHYSNDDYSSSTSKEDNGYSNDNSSYDDSYSNDDYSRGSSKENDGHPYDSDGSSKGGGYSNNDYSGNSSKDDDRYSNDFSSNDGNYSKDDYSGSPSKGSSDQDDNVEGNDYQDEEPINNPPYDDYDETVTAKQPRSREGSSTSKGGDEADMTFTEEEVYGNEDVSSHESEESDRPTSSGNVFERFIDQFGQIRFRNSDEVNQFFADHSDQSNFLAWFREHIGGRNYWRERNIPRQNFNRHLNNFNQVWDNIPLLYTGNVGNHEINVFQFFALVSIIINETGGTFRPVRERGSLSYMFGTNGGRKRSYNNYPPNRPNNRTAFRLFNNADFLAAHRDLAHYDRVANTTNRAWNSDSYPSGFPTDPSEGGIIAEADFYKFSGRGLVQTTWRRNYEAYIELVQNYSGQDAIVLEYKERWGRAYESLNIGIISSQTRNRDWDRLFLETNMEFASMAVYAYQHMRNDFLNIPVNASVVSRETNRTGSLYYVGYRVGGRTSYGRKVKNRIVQMMNELMRYQSS